MTAHRWTIGRNSIRVGSGNAMEVRAAVIRNSCIRVVGSGNLIEIDDYARVLGARITVSGSNNVVTLGERVVLDHAAILVEGAGLRVHLGANTQIRQRTNLVANGGAGIAVGRDCAISSDVEVRAGDSHLIMDLDGHVLNPGRDISIADHVWVGTRCVLLKGTTIESHTVIGAGSLVTRAFDETNVIITGQPARIVKRGITWQR